MSSVIQEATDPEGAASHVSEGVLPGPGLLLGTCGRCPPAHPTSGCHPMWRHGPRTREESDSVNVMAPGGSTRFRPLQGEGEVQMAPPQPQPSLSALRAVGGGPPRGSGRAEPDASLPAPARQPWQRPPQPLLLLSFWGRVAFVFLCLFPLAGTGECAVLPEVYTVLPPGTQGWSLPTA